MLILHRKPTFRRSAKQRTHIPLVSLYNRVSLLLPVLSPQARALLLQPGRGLLQALVSQLQSWNSLRRLGASGAIKNCVISAEVRVHVRARGCDKRDTAHPMHACKPIERVPSSRHSRPCSLSPSLTLIPHPRAATPCPGVRSPSMHSCMDS